MIWIKTIVAFTQAASPTLSPGSLYLSASPRRLCLNSPKELMASSPAGRQPARLGAALALHLLVPGNLRADVVRPHLGTAGDCARRPPLPPHDVLSSQPRK
jgi:hypothetical protein